MFSHVTAYVTAIFISLQYKFAISATSYTCYHFFKKNDVYIYIYIYIYVYIYNFLLLMVTW